MVTNSASAGLSDSEALLTKVRESILEIGNGAVASDASVRRVEHLAAITAESEFPRRVVGLYRPDGSLRCVVRVADPTSAGAAAVWHAQKFVACAGEVAVLLDPEMRWQS